MMVRFTATVCFFLFCATSQAQQFGGFKPSTKWKQINTDTARIIFTLKSERQAQRVASLLHQIAGTVNPLGSQQRKINIVLHSNTTLANGYVGLGPFRSEFYLIPGSNIFDFGNLPWEEQLVVHEYRHVQQYNNFNHGISKAAGVLFGQQGRALANALAVPDWFFEGDAVYAETVLTPQGRGRMPYFFNGFTSLWREGRNYSWMKWRNGSLKDLVPNHYPLGYLLVNYGYKQYGTDFWRKVTQDATAFKGVFYPFQKAVERHAGVSFKTFRQQAFNFYNHEISKRRDDQRQKEPVANYYFPQIIGKDSLLYLKETYSSLPAFYIKDQSGEHCIKLRDISSEDWLSYRNGTVAYTAYGVHPRWSLTDYSDIVLLNVASGKEERITHHQKYFSPSLSPDDSTLVAVAITDSLQTELHFMNRQGSLLHTRKAPAGAIFIQPQYIDDTSLVVGIRHANAKISIHRLNLNTMKFEQLMPATLSTVGFFYPYKNAVYFTSSLKGADEIYAYYFDTRTTSQITSGGAGSYFPNINNGVLAWSEMTSDGFRIRTQNLDSIVSVNMPIGQWGLEEPPFEVAYGDSTPSILTAPLRNFPVATYKKGTGLFNFHSRRPNYEDPELTVSLYGNNVLNTFASELYYRYNQNESSHAVGANVIYGGLFPQLSAGVEHTFERTVRASTRTLTVQQSEARFGYSIPLSFTRGKTYKLFNVGSSFVLNHTAPTGATKTVLRSFQTTYLQHALSWRQQLPRARQHIYSRLGYSVAGNFRHRTDSKGYQANGNGSIFLPGLLKNHSLVFTGSFQRTDTANVLFANRFSNSRGYPDYYFYKMWRGGVNYHLPLVYPDFGFANIVYLLRVRGNAFYDYTHVLSKTGITNRPLRSTGGEIFFDTKWWNSLPVTFGVRYSYLLDAKAVGISSPHVWEVVLPVSLVPN